MNRSFAPYMGEGPYIFVSYSHRDRLLVLRMMEELDRAGCRIWYDEGIQLSEAWPAVVQDRLDKCAGCLLFISPNSVESKHCLREIHRADELGKPIFPVYLKKTELRNGFGILLDSRQYLNFADYPNLSTFVERLKQKMPFESYLLKWSSDGSIKWSVDENGLLILRKEAKTDGRMPHYTKNVAPWIDLKEKILSVRIETGIINVGHLAFNGCSNLESVMIPDSVTTIGAWAFNGCSSLKSITIPDSVTFIGQSAFYGCSSLESVKISNSVTRIVLETFCDCSSLKSVTIPDSVTLIAKRAFAGTGLTEVSLPKNTRIDPEAFIKVIRRS